LDKNKRGTKEESTPNYEGGPMEYAQTTITYAPIDRRRPKKRERTVITGMVKGELPRDDKEYSKKRRGRAKST